MSNLFYNIVANGIEGCGTSHTKALRSLVDALVDELNNLDDERDEELDAQPYEIDPDEFDSGLSPDEPHKDAVAVTMPSVLTVTKPQRKELIRALRTYIDGTQLFAHDPWFNALTEKELEANETLWNAFQRLTGGGNLWETAARKGEQYYRPRCDRDRWLDDPSVDDGSNYDLPKDEDER